MWAIIFFLMLLQWDFILCITRKSTKKQILQKRNEAWRILKFRIGYNPVCCNPFPLAWTPFHPGFTFLMSLNLKDSSNYRGNTGELHREENAVIGRVLIRNWVPSMPFPLPIGLWTRWGYCPCSPPCPQYLVCGLGINKFCSGKQGGEDAWEEGKEEGQVEEVCTDPLNSFPFLLW